ncbi:MAG: hypothetical protein MK082_11335 [Phycisphaerales bacterium]|nr:hypothetical protein [Phycisphaerales bacterium]
MSTRPNQNHVLCTLATGLGLATAAPLSADVLITDVDNAFITTAELTNPALALTDEDETMLVTEGFETEGTSLDAMAQVGDAWSAGNAHAFAEELEDGFRLFGDSDVAYNLEAPVSGSAMGDSATLVKVTLEADLTRVSGQFCVRSGGDSSIRQVLMSFYRTGESQNPLVYIDNESGDDCREFELLLPPGEYQFRSRAFTFMTTDLHASQASDSWCQYGGEVVFMEIADPDINNDGKVDGVDLGRFLAQWGSDNPDFDFNGDGKVDGQDLAILIGAWT